MSRLPMSVLKLLVTGPALLVSAVLGLMALAVVSPVLAGLGMLGAGAAFCVLASGVGETEAIQLLNRARPATPGEREVVDPVLAAYGGVAAHPTGTAPGTGLRVFVRRSAGPATAPVVLTGRNSVVVTPWMIEAIYRGWITRDEASAIAIGAAGRHRAGNGPLEVATAVATTPWRAVATVACGIGHAFAWFPFMRFAWSVRGIVGAVAVFQSVSQGRTVYGVIAGVFVALTYLVPAARRGMDRQLEIAGDRLVVARGLGDVMSRLLRRADLPVTVDRLQRLETRTTRQPSPQPVLQLATYSPN